LKSRLGADVIPSAVLVRHVNPVINQLLALIQSELAYSSKVDIALPAFGSLWREAEQIAGKLPSALKTMDRLALTPE
jgi:hypothetical protein